MDVSLPPSANIYLAPKDKSENGIIPAPGDITSQWKKLTLETELEPSNAFQKTIVLSILRRKKQTKF